MDLLGDGLEALTRAVSVSSWRSTEAWGGEERGQAGVVSVLAGEERLTLFSRRQQARIRGESGQGV